MDLFDPLMEPQQVRLLWLKVDLGVMVMKGLLLTPRISRIETSSSDTVYSSGVQSYLFAKDTIYSEAHWQEDFHVR